MVAIPVISDIIKEIGATVREAIPDPDKRRELEIQLATLEQQSMLAQVEVNKIEAGSSNLFVAGWRPFIGWVCGVALAYTWILAPLLRWGAQSAGYQVDLPALAPESIFPVVTAMLGIGVMRTFEKTKGVASSVGGKVLVPQSPVTAEERASTVTPTKKKGKGWL
jgi:hypothetical protein